MMPPGPGEGQESPLPDEAHTAARRLASDIGFSDFGVARFPLKKTNVAQLCALENPALCGSMDWLSETARLRAHPELRWPECKSVLCLATSYRPNHNPLESLKDSTCAVIASYAHGKDYHIVIGKRLKRFVRELRTIVGGNYRAFVDTAPVAEKPFAAMTGIGWQGKHTNLVSRRYGSWLLLSVVLSDQRFPISDPTPDRCGSCTRCQTICPTNALAIPYRLNIPSCLAYLSIEHEGVIPKKWRSAMGNRVFGCDDCLAACPWNKFARQTSALLDYCRTDLHAMPISKLLAMTPDEFSNMFRQTPVKRLRWDRLIRNSLIAAGNSSDCKLLPLIRTHKNSSSPVILETAEWAERHLARHCEEKRTMPSHVQKF